MMNERSVTERMRDMKTNDKKNGMKVLLTAMLTGAIVLTGSHALTNRSVLAEADTATNNETAQEAVVQAPAQDTSPAIYVAQKNANSVVGIITSQQTWSRQSGVVDQDVAEGSGVVIRDGGYVLTNYHVVEGGDAYKVLMPDGTKVEATIAGTDSATDLAVLKVDEENAAKLTPVDIGTSEDLVVGSTVIAIGNPGGEVLANTVTMGIVSALERTAVTTSNTSRRISYIQHDAAINSGNSGGGLFNTQGELVGINTLKYSGSMFSSSVYEGLGFAIPVDTAKDIADQLIDNGVVTRPGLGIVVQNTEGPDEPLANTPPASVMIASINADSAADKAGLKQYDYITEVDGQRITSYLDLTSILDQHQPGDVVSVTVVRYNRQAVSRQNGYDFGYGNGYGFGYGFGDFFNQIPGYGYGYGQQPDQGQNGQNGQDGQQDQNGQQGENTQTEISSGYETITVDVTLDALDSAK